MLEWRLEAWRSQRSFERIAEERSLLYRVEQIFLIHRATNRWLLHVAADEAAANNREVLREVEEIGRDFFFALLDARFQEFFLGEKRIWMASGPLAHLAIVSVGDPPDELRAEVDATRVRIEKENDNALANYAGDPAAFERLAPQLTKLLRSESKPVPKLPKLPRVSVRLPRLTNLRPAALALAAVLLIATLLAFRSKHHWDEFVTRLRSEPGIAVGAAEYHSLGKSRISGMRDPLARDPATLAREAKLNPKRIHFAWTNYNSTDDEITRRRFIARFGNVDGATISVHDGSVQISGRVPNEWMTRVRREATEVPGIRSLDEHDVSIAFDPGRSLEQFREQFAPPETVRAVVANTTLVLAGKAPYDWITRVREGATQVPGITEINGDGLMVEFDAERVLARFREQFRPPDSVTASFQSGRLVLSGEAPHQWVDQVRRGVTRLPGVRVLDDRKVEDIDQREFQDAKSRIDEASVLFILNRPSLPPDANANVSRVIEDVRRCLAAAANLGINAVVELRGYGDAVGTDAANAELSKHRADSVRATLIMNGIEGAKLNSLGMGTPPRPPGQKSGAGQFDRRVFFHVEIQP